MTFDELLATANNFQTKFLSKDKCEPISERTLRYWISKGILEKRSTRGPKTTYPSAFVWRVILTRQYQLFTSKTLSEIAEIQAKTADKNVRQKVENFSRELSKEPVVSEPDRRANKSARPVSERYLVQAIAHLRREISSLSDQLKGASYDPVKMSTNVMESVDVGTLHADRLKKQASRLEDLYYSKEPLAELTLERASKVSLELLDELNDYKESTNVAQQNLARATEELIETAQTLRYQLSDQINEHLERQAVVARQAQEEWANVALQLRQEVEALRSDILKLHEKLSDEKGES